MPVYEYVCTNKECDHHEDHICSMSEYEEQNKKILEETVCPKCGASLRRQIFAAPHKWGAHSDAKFLGKHIDDTPYGRN